MVRVLVVDDSAFMRSTISRMLSSDPGIQVVGTARNGEESVLRVKELKPDIVTMDVEMPKMDGITALKHIMQECPVPVIMVSSLTTEGAYATLDALDMGAVDFIPKNLSNLSFNIIKIKEELIHKVKILGRKGLIRKKIDFAKPIHSLPVSKVTSERKIGERRVGILVIGTSTGGPKALQVIIPMLPKEFPVPVVVVQHMPPAFTGPFAERLNSMSQLEVREAQEGDTLKAGVVLVAPGRGHLRLRRETFIETIATISEHEEGLLYRPSVDVLFHTVAQVYPGRGLAVVLTGMGDDGLKGAREIKKSGGRIFAQNEETCVVYGMPKSIVDAGLADKVLAVEEIAGEIINTV